MQVEGEYWLPLVIGLLLGDGYISGREIEWSCAEPDLVSFVEPGLEINGFRLISKGIRRRIIDPSAKQLAARDCKTGRLVGHPISHRLRLELQRLGILGLNSGNKFIPEEVWAWPQAAIAALLAGLIASDGSVFWAKSGARRHLVLGYYSKSEHLICGFRDLLSAKFDIHGSKIHPGHHVLQIQYASKAAMGRFAQLPIPGRKGKLLQEGAAMQSAIAYK